MLKKLKKSNINLEEWEFEFQQRDRQSFLMADLWCRAIFYNFKKELNLPIQELDYLFTNSSKGYVKIKQKEKIISLLKDAINKDEKYLKYIAEATKKRVLEFEKIAKEIKKSNNVPGSWEGFDKKILELIPWFFIPWYVTEYNLLSDKVKAGLEKHRDIIEDITDFNNALMVLIFPIKEAMFQQEQDKFFELVKISKDSGFKDKGLIKKSKDYLDKFSWMKTFVTLPIEPLTLDELIEKVKSVDKEFINEHKLQAFQKQKNLELGKKIIEKIKKDKELMKNIELAREFGWLLTWSVESALKTTADLIPFFKALAKNINIPYSKWNNLTSEEIKKSLEGKFKISKRELNERKNYIFLLQNKEFMVNVDREGKEISDWVNSNVGKVEEDIKEFKGQPACSGKVRGKVRIIVRASESHKIEKGEVLVCSMTSPDYVSAMKKAAAIITDEGGLLSHASIVSRELGKPCVIGTRIATKVLHDGDEIEVDANNGIVKILKKNSKG